MTRHFVDVKAKKRGKFSPPHYVLLVAWSYRADTVDLGSLHPPASLPTRPGCGADHRAQTAIHRRQILESRWLFEHLGLPSGSDSFRSRGNTSRLHHLGWRGRRKRLGLALPHQAASSPADQEQGGDDPIHSECLADNSVNTMPIAKVGRRGVGGLPRSRT